MITHPWGRAVNQSGLDVLKDIISALAPQFFCTSLLRDSLSLLLNLRL